MDNSNTMHATGDISGGKLFIGLLWIISLVATGFIGYTIGQGGTLTVAEKKEENVLGVINQVSVPPTESPQVTQAVLQTAPCAKTGYAQKWEYLRSYTVKQGDSLPGIATKELGDEGRVNEILHLNGVGPLVVGSTLYLPPEEITKSSGKLKLVHGKLIERNDSMWHLSFNENEKGMGILIPTYWFEKIADRDSYQTGDCLSILLDDGNTVYSVERQQ